MPGVERACVFLGLGTFNNENINAVICVDLVTATHGAQAQYKLKEPSFSCDNY